MNFNSIREDDDSIIDSYVIKLDYDPDQDNLADSLAILSKIVEGHSKSNRILTGSFDQQTTSRIALNDIQTGSIKLFIQNVIRNIDDSEIKDKGSKAFLRQAIVEARKVLLNYIAEHEDIEDRESLSQIKGDLLQISERASSKNTIGIESLSDGDIAECLDGIAIPKGAINPTQKVKVVANGIEYEVNRNFRVKPETLERILLDEEQEWKDQEIKIKVKQPSYEGNGKWLVQEIDGKVVRARISDTPWLDKFQNNRLAADEFPYPKQVLKVRADILVKKDRHGFILNKELDITRVLGVEKDTAVQSKLEFDGE